MPSGLKQVFIKRFLVAILHSPHHLQTLTQERECLNAFAVCSWVNRAVLESEAMLCWHQDYKPVFAFILNSTASLIWFPKGSTIDPTIQCHLYPIMAYLYFAPINDNTIVAVFALTIRLRALWDFKGLKIYCCALLNVVLGCFQPS